MAQRRMFSKTITNSSEFLMMSPSAQTLYFHLGMNADDDGFCEVFTIMRMTESKPDDLKALHEKNLVYVVDTRVCILKDWHENNYIQTDRYTKSKYLNDNRFKEIYLTIMKEKVAHLKRYSPETTSCIQDVSKTDTQVRLGKDRLGKVNKLSSSTDDGFSDFWKKYPRKVGKSNAEKAWRKLKPELAMVLSALETQIQSEQWQKDNGKFIPHPTTWLNGKRWEDETVEEIKTIIL